MLLCVVLGHRPEIVYRRPPIPPEIGQWPNKRPAPRFRQVTLCRRCGKEIAA
jgi:hypothetical protein